jgi:hypothetical protein
VKKLMAVVCLVLSFHVLAQTPPLEGEWKTRIRNLVTRIFGESISVQLLGEIPRPASSITMPEIPKQFKKSTSVESYSKLTKDPTSFDKLPNQRKRQFDYMFVKELFQATRQVEAKDEDLSNWMNVLDQGGSREGIYQALVLDDVYAALENLEEKPSTKLIEFSMKISGKFFGQNYQNSSLEQLNLYSLKRILSEKGLDLMEYWEGKDLDALYRWYAIFSSDLAIDQGSWLRSEIRQQTSIDGQYEWAKSMPIQHIKSEFIIKLHTVMNGLQLLK